MPGLFAGTPFDRPPHCERCEKLESECDCPPEPTPEHVWLEPQKQTAKLAIEKRRKGKVVTVIRGLKADESDLPTLLTSLKTSCGAGGKLDDEGLEIQGRHLDTVRNKLSDMGYKVKG